MEQREALVDKIIQRIQEKLCGEDANPSVADLMRLLEFREELGQSRPRPMTVQWIDEWQQTAAEEE